MRCQSRTRTDQRCTNQAKPESQFCGIHRGGGKQLAKMVFIEELNITVVVPAFIENDEIWLFLTHDGDKVVRVEKSGDFTYDLTSKAEMELSLITRVPKTFSSGYMQFPVELNITPGKHMYRVSEYVGKSLYELLKTGTLMTYVDKLKMARDVLIVLEQAHKLYLHLDISWNNITRRGDTWYIIDWETGRKSGGDIKDGLHGFRIGSPYMISDRMSLFGGGIASDDITSLGWTLIYTFLYEESMELFGTFKSTDDDMDTAEENSIVMRNNAKRWDWVAKHQHKLDPTYGWCFLHMISPVSEEFAYKSMIEFFDEMILARS